MELLESNDMKSELIKKSAKHRQNLEEEVKLISARTEKAVSTALVVGGTLAASYFLVRMLAGSGSGSKKKRNKHKKIRIVHAAAASEPEAVEVEAAQQPSLIPNIISHVGTVIASQAMAALLGLAKEKLSEYLVERNAQKESNV